MVQRIRRRQRQRTILPDVGLSEVLFDERTPDGQDDLQVNVKGLNMPVALRRSSSTPCSTR